MDHRATAAGLLASVFHTLDIGAVVLDREHRVVLWNDWMNRHSRHDAGAALGRDFFVLFPEQAGRRLESAVRQALLDNFPALLSQSLHKAPLALFADRAARDGGCRMRQAIAVTPFEVAGADLGSTRHCLIQINDVSAAVLRERLLRTHALALREQSMSDGLTGIANRRHFDQVLNKEIRRARRAGKPLSLLMIDIDFFKAYNDHYGHQQGDDTLVRVAGALAARLQRPLELLARYGGEEFAVILPETPAQQALQVATALRQLVAQQRICHGAASAGPHVTVSIGVASTGQAPGWLHGADAAALIGAADRALYAAKRGGRDCVMVDTAPD
ncbi:diguanylate cyclase [Massilia sp. DWR3-1-1]|uniref:diguanylate cyclase n=1 Tax=Massilia sp. DWR3-1-1 TaxID=2804559 RepID=UPI003CE6EED5